MYSLDNRPKKVVITGVDFTVPEKDEALRQHLFVCACLTLLNVLLMVIGHRRIH